MTFARTLGRCGPRACYESRRRAARNAIERERAIVQGGVGMLRVHHNNNTVGLNASVCIVTGVESQMLVRLARLILVVYDPRIHHTKSLRGSSILLPHPRAHVQRSHTTQHDDTRIVVSTQTAWFPGVVPNVNGYD